MRIIIANKVNVKKGGSAVGQVAFRPSTRGTLLSRCPKTKLVPSPPGPRESKESPPCLSPSRSGFCLPGRSDKKITRCEERSWASLERELKTFFNL